MMQPLFAIMWIAAALMGSANSQRFSQSDNAETAEIVGRCNAKIQFNLYTKQHPERYNIALAKVEESIKNSTMDFKKRTKFLSLPHELQRTDVNFNEIVKKFIEKYDVNVIVVEWPLLVHRKREISRKDLYLSDAFFQGACFARLLSRLSLMEADSSTFDMIAFGEAVPKFILAAKLSYPFEVGRLTGINPITDNITITFFETKTSKETGFLFVDMIYTDLLPTDTVIDFGHVLFFPNGGLHPQPGVSESSRSDSRLRGFLYYIETLERPNAFVGKQSESWAKYLAKEYSNNGINRIGENVSSKSKGRFYLATNDKPPFGLES